MYYSFVRYINKSYVHYLQVYLRNVMSDLKGREQCLKLMLGS
jgi:hypothetical protein